MYVFHLMVVGLVDVGGPGGRGWRGWFARG